MAQEYISEGGTEGGGVMDGLDWIGLGLRWMEWAEEGKDARIDSTWSAYYVCW